MTSYKSLLNLRHCTIRKATAMISRIIWRVFSLLYGTLVLALFTAFAVLDGSFFRGPAEKEKKELAIGKLNTHPHQIQAEKSSVQLSRSSGISHNRLWDSSTNSSP